MPRHKKDGRNVNYFIDRQVHERLLRYADCRGQTITLAIERLLTAAMDAEGFPAAGRTAPAAGEEETK